MKKLMLSLCAFGVLCWIGADVLGQGKGGGKGRPERPARAERPQRPSNGADGKKEAKAQQGQKGRATQKAAEVKAAGQQRAAQQADAAKPKATKEATAQKKTAEETTQARGKNHQQQLRAFEAQRQRQRAKHMERQARLARIRELAVQKGDAKMIARVDKLIAKENQVHERKQTRLQQQQRTMMGSESAPAQSVETTPKGKGGAKGGVEKADRRKGDDADEKRETEREAHEDAQPQG